MGEAGALCCVREGKPWQTRGKSFGEMSVLTVRLLLSCRYSGAAPLGRHLCQVCQRCWFPSASLGALCEIESVVAASWFVLGFKLILKVKSSFLLKLTI